MKAIVLLLHQNKVAHQNIQYENFRINHAKFVTLTSFESSAYGDREGIPL